MSNGGAWDLDPMIEGGLYRYRKVGRALFSELALNDCNQCWDYTVGEIHNSDIVVYLGKYRATSLGYSWTMVRLLTANGIIGWASWNYGDWERVK